MSPSVLRRYTPPTCTLEIAATGSALSRWTDRTVLKCLRFHLSFDDPKLPPEQQITITGDRLQLEALHEAVESYVQTLLNQVPGQLNALLVPSNPTQDKLSVAQPKPTALSLTGSSTPTESGSDAKSSPESERGATRVYLQPKGLLAHDLHLGTLKTNVQEPGELGAVVRLSALQLFDLANALDEYHAESLTLPALGRPAWLQAPTGWARAAAVLVLAIGATGAVTKFVLDIASPIAQVASNSQEDEISVALPSGDIGPTPLSLPSAGTSSSELQLRPLFPPKPPAGALQPIPVPSENANLPPTGVTEAPPASVSGEQLPASQSPGEGSGSSSSQVVVLPTPIASSSGNSSFSLVDAPPPDLASSSSAAISPRVGESSSRLTSTPADPLSRSQAIGEEAPPIAVNSSTVFDSYPQIAEIRDYFSRQWHPPTELNQTLEYRLVLDAKGTIQRIIPLGDASERFVDRTNMPLMGELFVSPLQDREQLQVRLVLSPDGKVQTFADGN
jgi:hypothetical protein